MKKKITLAAIVLLAGIFVALSYSAITDRTKDFEKATREKDASQQNLAIQKAVQAAKGKTGPAANEKAGSIFAEQYSAEFEYPKNWGEFITPKTDKNGIVIDLPLKDFYFAGNCTSVCDKSFDKSFSSFPFNPKDVQDSITQITLGLYPETPKDDPISDENPFGWDKKTKQAIINQMEKIYNQKSIDEINITTKGFAGILPKESAEAVKEGYMSSPGVLFSPVNASSDVIGAKYVENKDGDLRGISFFKNEGQDYPFRPTYNVIMINPVMRIVFLAEFQLENIPELSPYRLEKLYNNGKSTDKDFEALIGQGYTYLENRDGYKDTEFGKFIASIDKLTKTVRITENLK